MSTDQTPQPEHAPAEVDQDPDEAAEARAAVHEAQDRPAGTHARPEDANRGGIPGKDRQRNVERLARQIEEEGWTGSPLVVHGDQVLGGAERYEAARFLGMETEVPSITLEEVFEEAGVDFGQVASRRPTEAGPTAEQGMFEDYLRELPRHVRDKYEL